MLFSDLCLKIYVWPFLSYLASLKGLCPFYPPGYFPTTALPPVQNMSTVIPTFQPTPPTTTLPPCPVSPLLCLAGGVRPIPYCPCIDPRQQNGETTEATTASVDTVPANTLPGLPLRLAASNDPPAAMGKDIMIFSHLQSSKKAEPSQEA